MSVRLRLGLVLGLLIVMLTGIVYVGVNALNVVVQDASELNGIGVVRTLSGRLESLAQGVVSQDARTTEIQQALQTAVDEVGLLSTSMRQLYASGDSITRDEFAIFLDDIRRDFPAVRTGQFASRVTAFERGQFETGLQTEGFSGFRIKERDANGNLITAGQRTEYFPINYIAPFKDNENVFGYDIAAIPELLVVLNQARDTGRTIATPPVTLLADRDLTFMLVTPIYLNGLDASSLDSRRALLRGYVIAEVEIARLIDQTALARGRGFDIASINDVTTAETPLSLFSGNVSEQSSRHSFGLTLFERQWDVVITTDRDRAGLLSELTTVMTDIQERVAALQDAPTGGLARHTSPEIIPTYNELVNLTNSLAIDINRFVNATSSDLREDLLPGIELTGSNMTENTDNLVNLLVTEQEAQAESTGSAAVLIAVFAITIAVFGAFTLLGIFRRLNALQTTARDLAQGELDARVQNPTNDEIGQIGQALNTMAGELTTVIGSLEDRINVRTRDLQTVADVNTQISTILDPQRLLQDVADLTKERFGLYHSHVYLFDEEAEGLVLMAGAGHVGRQMVNEGRFIPMDNEISIVANAARSRRGVIINDVAMSETFLPNPLLPDTKSELAVPLIARGQLLGVLDVQADETGFFTQETLSVLELLAGQIATALSNAQLYDVAERTSRHERALGAIDRRIQNAVDVDDILQTAVRELGKALRVPYTAIELQLDDDENSNGHE